MINKQFSLGLVFLFLSTCSFAQTTKIEFTINRTQCLLSFADAAGGWMNCSQQFQSFILEQIPASDTTFYQLIDAYKKIPWANHIRKEGYPMSRHAGEAVKDIVLRESVFSKDLQELENRIKDLLTAEELASLIKVLHGIQPYYDRLVWKDYAHKFPAFQAQLQAYQNKVANLFGQIRQFYHSDWPQDMPFVAAFYPIPGAQGHTTATPHGNTLVLGYLTDKEKDYEGRLGVLVHEMCHSIYDQQSRNFQHQLDRWFNQHPNPYRSIAYQYINEAMATAIGNGWGYQQLFGQLDTMEWYADPIIDGFAHTIYAETVAYLEAGKSMDSLYVDHAIKAFEQTFPGSIYDYSSILMNTYLFADASSQNELQFYQSKIKNYFKINSFNFSSPIKHEKSIDFLKTANSTLFILVTKQHEQNIATLKKAMPEIASLLPDQYNPKGFFLSFIDSKKRPVLVLATDGNAQIDQGFELIQQLKTLSMDKPFHHLPKIEK